jgi:hypothetical protein
MALLEGWTHDSAMFGPDSQIFDDRLMAPEHLMVADRHNHRHYDPNEDVAHQLNDDLTPDGILHLED